MTVSLERLRSKLSPLFPGLEQIDESVIRFERRSRQQAYAVCYVDVSGQVPTTVASLNDYQERIVGTRYFQGRKSLQWSNYLFFVVDNLPQNEMRSVVERDRRYARKFVVTEIELDAALSPPAYMVSEEAIKTDILSTWTNILAASNLDRAILNDESLPARLELIEKHYSHASSTALRSRGTPQSSKQPFLQRIYLEHFRPYPLKRTIDIGTVTLLFGVNGSGKTSVLEAIELAYCGQTKRNPRDNTPYTIQATFGNGSQETATIHRGPNVFRDRNLAWYGQYDQRVPHLYQSFGRFNFLDTDAAAGLADPKTNAELEEDLAKLLVGPDASRTWKEIERTADRIDEKINELQASYSQAERDYISINHQLSELGNQKQESNAVLRQLDGLLVADGWTRAGDNTSVSVQNLVEVLAGYSTLVSQAVGCDWAGAPVTTGVMQRFVLRGRDRVASAEAFVKELSLARASESKASQELLQIQQSLDSINQLRPFFAADMHLLTAQLKSLAASIAGHTQPLAGLPAAPIKDLITVPLSLTVAEFARSAGKKLERATKRHADSQRRYSDFIKLRDESSYLAHRLRDIAAQLLRYNAEYDVCPLCHTRFKPGDFAKHMHVGVDRQAESKASTLLNAMRSTELSLRHAEATDKAAQWAIQACSRLSQDDSITVSRLLDFVLGSQKDAEAKLRLRTQVTDQLARLQGLGLTTKRYNRLLDAAHVTGEELSLARLDEKCKSLELLEVHKAAEKAGYSARCQDLHYSALRTLDLVDATPDAIDSELSELKEQIVTTEGVLSKLEPYLQKLPWSTGRPLSELAITIETVRLVAGDFQRTLSKEQGSVKALTEASLQKGHIETRLASLRPRIERFSEARGVLRSIQNGHSLSSAMEKALKHYRTAIESIFTRIHSPAEFSGLGDALCTLVRKSGGLASLQQISTGQRAAFALSLFLAQNAQLRTAPPLILIDDPIAHVDDLNCLSFLDYLRDVVISGERQVVFATANEKLAALFERKFDFLGDNSFIRHNLVR